MTRHVWPTSNSRYGTGQWWHVVLVSDQTDHIFLPPTLPACMTGTGRSNCTLAHWQDRAVGYLNMFFDKALWATYYLWDCWNYLLVVLMYTVTQKNIWYINISLLVFSVIQPFLFFIRKIYWGVFCLSKDPEGELLLSLFILSICNDQTSHSYLKSHTGDVYNWFGFTSHL